MFLLENTENKGSGYWHMTERPHLLLSNPLNIRSQEVDLGVIKRSSSYLLNSSQLY